MSGMVDRLLLILLILLLPVGIITTKFFAGNLQLGNRNVELEKKIDTAITQLSQQVGVPKSTAPSFSITGITNATTSGQLVIGTIAPVGNKPLWVSVAGAKKTDKKDPAATISAQQIQHIPTTFVVSPNGSTSYAIKIPTAEYIGIVEIRIEQEQSSIGIRYDLDKNKEITF